MPAGAAIGEIPWQQGIGIRWRRSLPEFSFRNKDMTDDPGGFPARAQGNWRTRTAIFGRPCKELITRIAAPLHLSKEGACHAITAIFAAFSRWR
jgi:hypothetical protein